jgi:pimeloyl-ACP methyl ester carboxylesterase
VQAVAYFVLVAGGGHGPWCWDRLTPELHARGHSVATPDVPADVADAGLCDYVNSIALEVPSQGDVVVVGHSMAGAYLPLLATRLGAARQIFLCAYVPQAGQSVFPADSAGFEAGDDAPAIEVDEQGRLAMDRYSAETTKALLCGDCDDATVAQIVSRLRPQGMAVMLDPFPADGWPVALQSAFICCADDAIQSPDATRETAAAFGVEPIELPGSHSPMMSRPAALAEALVTLLESPAYWATGPATI